MNRLVDAAILLTISTLWAGALLLTKIDVAVFPPLVLGAFGLLLAIGPERIEIGSEVVDGVALAGLGFSLSGVYCVLTERLAKDLAPAPAASSSASTVTRCRLSASCSRTSCSTRCLPEL